MPFTAKGFVPYTAQQLLTNMQQVFINVFGQNVDLTPSQPVGQLIQELTNILIDNQNVYALLYSGVYNPDIATGVFLESIGKLNSIDLLTATSSQVTVSITGIAGTVIPVNSQIISTNNDIFYNKDAINIGSNGTATGIFYSTVTGEVPVYANTVNRIIQNVNGWDSVNNTTDGVLGRKNQTDYSFRQTLKSSLGKNSSGGLQSIFAALADTSDVIDFAGVENYQDNPISQLGVTVPGHGIYLSVYGGIDEEIANILYTKKSDGCNMAGNTSLTINDSTYSWNTFTAIWQRPTPIAIQINVNLPASNNYPANLTTLIINALLSNFNDGLLLNNDVVIDRVKMGVPFNNARFYPSIVGLGVYDITSLTTGIVGQPPSTGDINLPISQVATLNPSDINVVIASS